MMKRILALLCLACLSLAAGAQSKFDTGTHATSALGQLEEMSGQHINIPSGNHTIVIPAARAVSAASSAARSASSGGSTLGLALNLLTPILFSALDALESSPAPSASSSNVSYVEAPNPVAPDRYDECDADIVSKFPPGCKFERHYPVPGEKDWYLELDMTNESSVDHDFTIIFWEKDLPQNRIHNPLLGISVNGHYDTATPTTRYKIEKIIYND